MSSYCDQQIAIDSWLYKLVAPNATVGVEETRLALGRELGHDRNPAIERRTPASGQPQRKRRRRDHEFTAGDQEILADKIAASLQTLIDRIPPDDDQATHAFRVDRVTVESDNPLFHLKPMGALTKFLDKHFPGVLTDKDKEILHGDKKNIVGPILRIASKRTI